MKNLQLKLRLTITITITAIKNPQTLQNPIERDPQALMGI